MLSLDTKIQIHNLIDQRTRLKAKRSRLTTTFELFNLPAEAGGELLEADGAVVVGVELAEQVDAVLLQVRVASRLFLNLAKDVLDVLLGEHLGVVLHVLLGVLVGGHQLEAEAAQKDSAAEEEVLLGVVVARDGVLVVLAIHELSTDTAAVLVADLVDQDRVVTAEERDDELTVLIIGLSRDKLAVEAENMHVLLEHLLHVSLGGLRLQVGH